MSELPDSFGVVLLAKSGGQHSPVSMGRLQDITVLTRASTNYVCLRHDRPTCRLFSS